MSAEACVQHVIIPVLIMNNALMLDPEMWPDCVSIEINYFAGTDQMSSMHIRQ
jgi:hypothetical protein